MTKPRFLRALSALLCLLLALSGCSAASPLNPDDESLQVMASVSSDPQEDAGPEPITSIRVPYDPTDSFDPYTVRTSVNRFVVGLLYDGLVRLSPRYEPEPVLAESFFRSGLVWTITLRSDRAFPSSELTSADLLYSFERAMAPGSLYAESLAGIESLETVDNRTLRVTLLEEDPWFMGLLTFPVIEYGSAGAPVGIGRYTLMQDAEGLPYLRASDPETGIRTVELIELTDHNMLLQETRVGTFDIAFVDSPMDGQISAIGAMEPVTENNLIYLGFNASSGPLYTRNVRRALEMCIDREYIAREIYQGHAAAAHSILNPAFYGYYADEEPPARTPDIPGANEFLDELIYYLRDEENFRRNPMNGQNITFRIAVNGESAVKVAVAYAVRDMLAEIGMRAVVTELPYASYLEGVQNGLYPMYIGEVHFQDNMDVSPLLSASEGSAYGFPETPLSASFDALRAGGMSFSEFDSEFYYYMPMIPLVYRKGYVSFSRSFYFPVLATENDIFYNIQEW